MMVSVATPYRRFFHLSDERRNPCHIGGHCLIKGPDGWHLFGEMHKGSDGSGLGAKEYAHARCDTLTGEWESLPTVFRAEEGAGEVYLGAPYIVFEKGLYSLFYGVVTPSGRSEIHLAVSEDLYRWQRSQHNPVLEEEKGAGDPMVTKIGEAWVMYYVADGILKSAESDDLTHWHNPREVLTGVGEPCESPCVFEDKGQYYLLFGFGGHYNQTLVLKSEDPFCFSLENTVGSLPAHAAKIAYEQKGTMPFTTHCGEKQGGVYLAPLLI